MMNYGEFYKKMKEDSEISIALQESRPEIVEPLMKDIMNPSFFESLATVDGLVVE